MPEIGFHASHELYSPKLLLEALQDAERRGFECAMCSDHFRPWIQRGNSGHAFSWLGAALAKTRFSIGSVHAPGQRYHPAISAQAISTLAEMFPGRTWVALGSGQALNESVTGGEWPDKIRRNQRLYECASAIRAMLQGQRVNTESLIRIKDGFLYTRPEISPPILAAAISNETAEWAGNWADGMITIGKMTSDIKAKMQAFRLKAGNQAPVYLQAAVSWGATQKEAEHAAVRNWPVAVLKISENEDTELPEDMERLSKHADGAMLSSAVRISADLERHIQWLEEDFAAGIERVYLHYIGDNLKRFIEVFSKEVLPKVRR